MKEPISLKHDVILSHYSADKITDSPTNIFVENC